MNVVFKFQDSTISQVWTGEKAVVVEDSEAHVQPSAGPQGHPRPRNQEGSKRNGNPAGFVCREPGCSHGNPFTRLEHLHRHVNGVHLKIREFQCPHLGCGQKSTRLDNFRIHLNNHSTVQTLVDNKAVKMSEKAKRSYLENLGTRNKTRADIFKEGLKTGNDGMRYWCSAKTSSQAFRATPVHSHKSGREVAHLQTSAIGLHAEHPPTPMTPVSTASFSAGTQPHPRVTELSIDLLLQAARWIDRQEEEEARTMDTALQLLSLAMPHAEGGQDKGKGKEEQESDSAPMEADAS